MIPYKNGTFVYVLFMAECVQMQSGEPQGWKNAPKSNIKDKNCLFLHSGDGKSASQLQKPRSILTNEMKSNVLNVWRQI